MAGIFDVALTPQTVAHIIRDLEDTNWGTVAEQEESDQMKGGFVAMINEQVGEERADELLRQVRGLTIAR